MLRFFAGLFLTLNTASAYSNILILEAFNDGSLEHGEAVASIACPQPSNCFTQYFTTFTEDSIASLLNNESHNFTTVNMSFTQQKPQPEDDSIAQMDPIQSQEQAQRLQQALSDFNENMSRLESIITTNQKLLFVASSGNGLMITKHVSSAGTGIKESTQLFPSAWKFENLIKVSAIDKTSISSRNIEDYQLADYANYSLLTVDVAAPVEDTQTGEHFEGTSFAAPFVSRLSDSISTKYPDLSPPEIIGILNKSCHVKNLNQAIAASTDLNRYGALSRVYQAMFNYSRTNRQRLQHEIGDIVLVKCGGVILEDVAQKCADNYSNSMISTEQACSMAHHQIRGLSVQHLDKLAELWSIRNL